MSALRVLNRFIFTESDNNKLETVGKREVVTFNAYKKYIELKNIRSVSNSF